jgi:hypothetical protein
MKIIKQYLSSLFKAAGEFNSKSRKAASAAQFSLDYRAFEASLALLQRAAESAGM